MELTTEALLPPKRPGPVRRLLRRIRNTEAGQALVEFTMILPIFLLLLFALVDFGRAFYTWLVVTQAAREGARAAAVQADDATVNARIYGSFCNSYPSNCGLDPAKLSISKSNIQGNRGDTVTVDLRYSFSFATPLGDIVKFVSAGNITAPTITAHSSTRLE